MLSESIAFSLIVFHMFFCVLIRDIYGLGGANVVKKTSIYDSAKV